MEISVADTDALIHGGARLAARREVAQLLSQTRFDASPIMEVFSPGLLNSSMTSTLRTDRMSVPLLSRRGNSEIVI